MHGGRLAKVKVLALEVSKFYKSGEDDPQVCVQGSFLLGLLKPGASPVAGYSVC